MQTTRSKDGTPIAYWESGQGPPLVLVHGTTADHLRWSTITPYFEPHYRVVAMDRRGRGGSGDSPDYDLQREAEDVAAVIEAMGEPVSVLGHSYGGVCSLEAALLTDQINRLILYEPPLPDFFPAAAPGIIDRIQSLTDAGKSEAGLEVFMREIVKMPERELKEYRQLPMWQVRIGLAPTIARENRAIEQTYQFIPEKFSNLQTPTLLLLGGDSSPFMKKGTALIHDSLPNSQVVIMPGQQHIAMDIQPELFRDEVLGFLGSTN